MNTLYQITKILRGDTGRNQDVPVKTEDGTTITEETAKRNSYCVYFLPEYNRESHEAYALQISGCDLTRMGD